MYKYGIITIFLITTSFISLANNKLIAYYVNVHNASVAFSKNNLALADSIFRVTLKRAENPFLIDVNNALIIEFNKHKPDTTIVIKYLKLIQQKGICVHDKFKTRKNALPYLGLVKESECKTVVEPRFRDLIASMIAKDQKVRKRITKFPPSQFEIDQMRSVDAANFKVVEKILTLAIEKDIMLENLIGEEGIYYLFSLIQHSLSHGFYCGNLLDKLVLNGKIDTRLYSTQIDYFYSIGYLSTAKSECNYFGKFGSGGLHQFQKIMLICKLPIICEEHVVNQRRKYYLNDLLEETKIRAFCLANNKAGFVYYGDIMLGVDANEFAKIENDLTSKYKTIKYVKGEDFNFEKSY